MFTKLAIATVVAALAAPALAANVDVQLLNKGDMGAMTFQPDLIRIAPGDTITFQPVDKGHDVETIAGMLPAGATAFKGEISKPLTETLTYLASTPLSATRTMVSAWSPSLWLVTMCRTSML